MADKRVGGGTGRGSQGRKAAGGSGGDKRKQGPRQPLSMKRGGPARQGAGDRNRPDAGKSGGPVRQGTSDRSRPDARKSGGQQPRERSRRSFEPPEFSTQKPTGPRPERGAGGRTTSAGRPEGRPAGKFVSRPENRPESRPAGRFGSRPEGRPGPGRGGQSGGRDRQTFPERRPERRIQSEPKREQLREKPPVPVQAPIKIEEPDDRIWGLNPVLELLRSGSRPVDAIWVDSEKGGKQFGEIIQFAKGKGIPVKFIPKEGLDKMSGGMRHQGVIAAVSPKEYADPYTIAEDAVKNKKAPLLLVLDGIEDPHNLGAIIRTAESAGADGIILPEHRAAHLTSTVAKASAGALEYMPVAKVPNLAGYLDFLKEKGFWVAGLAGEAEKDYASYDFKGPVAIVLGSEGEGIRPLVRKKCDILLSLPMLGKISSLNVSVAAGVVLYEAVKQRKTKS